jgi:anhydro-N-acetylmuramic acid kinase
MLFGDYRFCLNIGGFANISFEENGRRIAFDVCPANFVLNFLTGKIGKPFDEDGKFAASGNVIPELSNHLNHLDFYHQSPPKSLGREWVEANIFSLFSENDRVPDLLRTMVEHIAHQVSEVTKHHTATEILVTGGGAKNEFLMERISASTNHKVIIPDDVIIDYKEALIFAFLGVLRILQQPGCLGSVTGADTDNVGGAVYTF